MYFCVVLCIVCFVSFSVLFVCICVLYYCHRVATQIAVKYIISYHVSVVTITHHQERKQLYLQRLVFVTPLLLSAAIVEELELV